MAKFRHVRTGKIIDVPGEDAHRFRNDRYEQVDDSVPGPVAKVDVLPAGTVAEVLEWAGDDPVRRMAALQAEKRGKNRKGIIEALA